MSAFVSFDVFFATASGGHTPYDYQFKLADLGQQHDVGPFSLAINVPTGAGKTAAVILAWLWNRCAECNAKERRRCWPRRLVYCLPMRTLVEQTRRETDKWLANLKQAGLIADDVAAFTLMGSVVEKSWQRYPERTAILIGTQDMLLSRALNRGYAMSRYRWPIDFGLLNNDCLWVCDEVQLMGPAFETSLQLDAFRPHRWKTFGPTATWWLSATLDEWSFQTVDREAIQQRIGTPLLLDAAQLLCAVDNDPKLEARLKARKSIALREKLPKAAEVIAEHSPGSLTLVVFNTVKTARSFHESLLKETNRKKAGINENPSGIGPKKRMLLIHSQFRPGDRRKVVRRLLAYERLRKWLITKNRERQEQAVDLLELKTPGLIVVTTQVIEAGVDISSRRLWSQVAPWPSIVQRLGRLNRDGQASDAAAVFWLEVTKTGQVHKPEPYEAADLLTATERLAILAKDVRNGTERFGEALRSFPVDRRPEIVIRPPDVWELFDTDPDLHGGFTDISPYIRAVDRELHAYVLWRDFAPEAVQEEPAPDTKELCSVPFYELSSFLKDHPRRVRAVWLFHAKDEETWEGIWPDGIRPGMTILLPRAIGGYDKRLGWTGEPDGEFSVFTGEENDDLPAEPRSLSTEWMTIEQHTDRVCAVVDSLLLGLENIGLSKQMIEAFRRAARWHDRGKGHPRWQQNIEKYGAVAQLPPPVKAGTREFWAKSPDASLSPIVQALIGEEERKRKAWSLNRVFRPGLRHECASALAARRAWLDGIAPRLSALAVYLVATHHGKVRMTLRPNLESDGTPRAREAERNAFGVFERDGTLPATDLGGETAPTYEIDLECMEIGAIERNGQDEPSWIQMVSDLLGPCDPDTPSAPFRADRSGEVYGLGPFRLALLETLLCVADWKGSES